MYSAGTSVSWPDNMPPFPQLYQFTFCFVCQRSPSLSKHLMFAELINVQFLRNICIVFKVLSCECKIWTFDLFLKDETDGAKMCQKK